VVDHAASLWGLPVALGIGLLAPSTGRAQVAGGNIGADPFTMYYSWYLPNQAYQAAQPRPEDTINANAAARQYNALRDRGDLYDPVSPFGGDEGVDPFAPYAPRRPGASSRIVGNPHQGNVHGGGPQTYYYRHDRYFPGLRRGSGPNKNIYSLRSPRGGGGMPSMPSGMGPR